MKATDEQIIEAWEEHQNFAAVGRALGMTKQSASSRYYRLLARGVELSPPRKPGYILTSERAAEIARMKVAKSEAA